MLTICKKMYKTVEVKHVNMYIAQWESLSYIYAHIYIYMRPDQCN